MFRSIRQRLLGSKRKHRRNTYRRKRRMLFEGLEPRQMMDAGLVAQFGNGDAAAENDALLIAPPAAQLRELASQSTDIISPPDSMCPLINWVPFLGLEEETYAVELDSVNNVLFNHSDTFLPVDCFPEFRITNVSPTTRGGAVKIVQDGWSLVYTPVLGFQGEDTFTYTSASGISQDVAVRVKEAEAVKDIGDLVQIRLETTDTSGSPVNSIAVGEPFVLNVYVEDLRDVPHGVFAAYLDVTFDPDLATVSGPFTYTGPYQFGMPGNTETPGLIDELGAFAFMTEPGDGEFRLVSIPFTAAEVGQVNFGSSPADGIGTEVLLYGSNDPVVPMVSVGFGRTSLEIVGGPQDAVGEMNSKSGENPAFLNAFLIVTEVDGRGPRSPNVSSGLDGAEHARDYPNASNSSQNHLATNAALPAGSIESTLCEIAERARMSEVSETATDAVFGDLFASDVTSKHIWTDTEGLL